MTNGKRGAKEAKALKKKCLIMVVMFIFHYHVNLMKPNL